MRSDRDISIKYDEIDKQYSDRNSLTKGSPYLEGWMASLDWVLSGDDTFRADVRMLVEMLDRSGVQSETLNKVRRHLGITV